jgi:hypothetical protein
VESGISVEWNVLLRMLSREILEAFTLTEKYSGKAMPHCCIPKTGLVFMSAIIPILQKCVSIILTGILQFP